MNIETVLHESFTMAILHNALTTTTFASLTPALANLLQKHPGKDLVLDLTDVPSMDANTVRLLVNLNRKLETNRQKLLLLNPRSELKTVLAATPGVNEIAITASVTDLQRSVNDEHYRKYLPYTIPEGDQLRLRLSCGVCGSSSVFGYLLEQNRYKWSWPADDYFPQCQSGSGTTIDYFNTLPIVCGDCLTASIDIGNFNILDENNTVVHHGTYNDQTKIFLSKTIKKRKKLIEETNVVINDNFFRCPRNRQSAFFCYVLAESCARAASVNHTEGSMFYVGYLNYLALYFADRERKQGLIDDCRTWLTQAIAAPDRYSHTQLAVSYFIIFVTLLSLNKYKEAGKIMADFSNLINQANTPCPAIDSISCPRFWFMRAESVWKEEIAKKSAAIAV